jgi:undecaprenyl-diphosphatase
LLCSPQCPNSCEFGNGPLFFKPRAAIEFQQSAIPTKRKAGATVMPQFIAKTIEWLGGHELTVLLGLFVIVAGTFGFIQLAGEVMEGDTTAFDDYVLRAMREPDPKDPSKVTDEPVGPEWLEKAQRDVTALGGYTVLTLVTLAVVGFLRLDGKRAVMWFVVASIVSGYLVTMGLKDVFQRERPSVVEPVGGPEMTYSFPSGHSMMSAIIYLTLGALLARMVTKRRLKFYFLLLAVLLTAMVGTSRVFLGVHYPTDVVAGWLAGLVWATFCWLVARWFQRRGTIEQEL